MHYSRLISCPQDLNAANYCVERVLAYIMDGHDALTYIRNRNALDYAIGVVLVIETYPRARLRDDSCGAAQ